MTKKSCEHGVWPAGGICGICWHDDAVKADMVNSPPHYKVGGIEAIEYIQAKLSPEEFAGYCRGNMLKYVSRAGHKADAAEDMRKALWYGERWLKARDAGA